MWEIGENLRHCSAAPKPTMTGHNRKGRGGIGSCLREFQISTTWLAGANVWRPRGLFHHGFDPGVQSQKVRDQRKASTAFRIRRSMAVTTVGVVEMTANSDGVHLLELMFSTWLSTSPFKFPLATNSADAASALSTSVYSQCQHFAVRTFLPGSSVSCVTTLHDFARFNGCRAPSLKNKDQLSQHDRFHLTFNQQSVRG
jgi:hypothetical protein